MQNLSKINTYIGFSIRSGQIIYGSDNLLNTRKRIKLIMLCDSLAKASEEKMIELASAKNIPLIKLQNVKMEDIVHKSNCKVIGLTNKNLAQAVIDSAQDRVINSKGGDI